MAIEVMIVMVVMMVIMMVMMVMMVMVNDCDGGDDATRLTN